MSYCIRNANLTDIDWILQELKKFSDFYGSKKFKFYGDESYMADALKICIEKHLFLICEKLNHGPIGFISGLIIPHYFNPAIICLQEQFWYVKEEFRNSRAGMLLVKAFTEFGKNNVDLIFFNKLTKTNVKNSSLEKLGYKFTEQKFSLEV